LIGGLVLGLVLLLIRAGAQNTLSHDDAISLLAATGHLGAYAADVPAGRWAPAQTWQAYWTPERFPRFQQIGRDLARYDIHPPLYFWLLHIWVQVTGVKLSAGPLLNAVLLLLAAWIIALACRLAQCSRGASALAAVMWLLSGATLSTAGETRQYCLLALAVAALAASLMLFLGKRSLAAALPVCAAAAAGLLVHYQFAIVLAVALSVAGILLARGRHWRAVAILLVAAAAAGITFLLLHPGFLGSFALRQEQAAPFAWTDIPYRVSRIIAALFEQVAPLRLARVIGGAAARYWGLLVLIALAVGLGIGLVVRRRASGGRMDRTDSQVFLIGFTLATCAVIAALYLFQLSPRHAMGAQYLMVVSPLLFMAGAVLFDRLTRGRRWRLVLILLLIVYQAAYGGWTTFAQAPTSDAPPAVLASGSPILLDSAARGVLPPVLWHVPAATPVYAAMQDDLLGSFPAIPDDVRRLVYVSDLRYGNDVAKQGRVLEHLAAQGFRSAARRGSVNGTSAVFALTR
jgi:uncharacterized membrane protein